MNVRVLSGEGSHYPSPNEMKSPLVLKVEVSTPDQDTAVGIYRDFEII